ncbi:DDE-type integrase/transposase/recombinase [Chelativorans sp. ZYF759]|uniref:Mu transposase C-terminal domain-containing protein n=1 Tax=Chelativorans sp. ZYF759 TaxID=2692213 RepID=UPI00145D2B65|nr:Mu transposase C-terminal domain-containing protein [Chelativorans sp. ZYF759]NMG41441.1 DDE-type integrase/transposase/recombinase [Chelativorans sp. ZYF759]
MDHDSTDSGAWAQALSRAEILAKLSDRPDDAELREAMRALGISRATLFRWLKRFRQDERTSALLPRRRGPNAGMQPLDPAVLAVVEQHFEKLYATRRKPTLTRFQREVAADCRAGGLPPPSIRRLGRWLKSRDQADLMQRREGAKKSESVFLPTPGGLTAEAPLDIVQIDHTKVDVTVVDPVTRLPIGRPTLTLAIDVNTRMALGFSLSLEAPSLTAVALCLTHAAMDKTAWLASRGIAADWPAHGIPKTIHVDNGAEFHARAFERACGEHRIDLSYRPPGTPRFGGHIERLIGTMMGAVHLIPGSHFSNIRERGDLDPEAEAVMTLGELETYIALEIVGAYHARIHKALDMPPSAAWNARIGETAVRMPSDPRQFLIDFLPSEDRVLQRDGLHLFHIRYWSDELRWLMGRERRRLTVKYDPRDLSCVFVATEQGYLEARPADRTRPAIALWEQRAARRALRAEGRRAVDEELIFSTILAQRALVEEATRTTKAMRRDLARRDHLAATKMIDVTPQTGTVGDDQPLQLPYFEVEEWDD